MLINLYFGDYCNDGHGRYHHVCIEAPSEELVIKAKEKIEKDYPKFFKQFAYRYMDNSIGPQVEESLLTANYPIERFIEYQDDIKYDDFTSLKELFDSEIWENDEHRIHSIDLVADATIWMLNYYGAQAKEITCPKAPTITFTAGYGLFN